MAANKKMEFTKLTVEKKIEIVSHTNQHQKRKSLLQNACFLNMTYYVLLLTYQILEFMSNRGANTSL